MRAHLLSGPNKFWLPIFIVAIIVASATMPGFFGGGADDWQYLNAARCWVDKGPCLPTNHWAGRWPVTLPLAALLSIFGESRTTVALWPLVAGTTALGLAVTLGNKVAGRPAGWLVGILLLFTPAFSIQFLTPSVESLELAFLLAGGLCVANWVQTRTPATAAMGGFSLAMAFQVRETAIVAIALIALFVISQRPRIRELLPAVAGFLVPIMVELALYWHVTGDPFYRRNLSVAHTLIPSAELLGPIDTGNAPFFNKAYIANWRREPGVHVHWLIDGMLNLFVNARAGLCLPFTAILLTFYRRLIPRSVSRLGGTLFAFSISYVAILIYVLAVDPKPRIMLVPLTICLLALSAFLVALWQNGEVMFAKFLIAAHIVSGSVIMFAHPRINHVEDVVAGWITRYPESLESDPRTLEHLALVPGVSKISGLGERRPFLLHATESGCGDWSSEAGLPQGAVRLVEALPMNRLKFVNAGTQLCMFQYQKHIDRHELLAAIQRSFGR